MGKIVLLAVAAAWAAVLIPPLIRSRVENRPNSSVTDFRRQLSTLQRTVPTRGIAPMRTIGRPLTQAPSARPATRQSARSAPAATSRSHLHVASLDRPAPTRSHAAAPSRRPSPREVRRRRRANVLFLLVVAFLGTLVAFAATKSDAMMYAFVISFFSLMGYCYKLVQLRNEELDRLNTTDTRWYHAA